MALYDDLLERSNSLLGYFGDQAGKSTGLAPEVMSSLRTQAMETIPAQFADTQSNLATSLLRRGGGLPAGGEFLRTYAPLQAAKLQTSSNLQRDITLADQAERSRTLDLNNQNALAAASQSGSLGANLLGQTNQNTQFYAGLQQQKDILASQQQFAGTQAALDRALQSGMQTEALQNALRIAEMENAPASTKSLILSALLASLLSGGSSGGGGLLGSLVTGGGTNGTGSAGLLGDALGALGIGGSTAAATGAGTTAATGALATELAPALAATPPLLAGPAEAALPTTTGGSGLLAALAPIMPLAAAAIPAYFTIKSAQMHPVADTWVQYRQNPFDEAMKEAETADPAMRQVLVRDYLNELYQFANEPNAPSSHATVAQQALDTFKEYYGDPAQYGVNITLPTVNMLGPFYRGTTEGSFSVVNS